MRWRPEEDHEEQHDRGPGELVGDGGPADERGKAAGRAAPDDVLGGPALEDHRVADDVEHVGSERETGREPVDEQAEPDGGDDPEHETEHQGRPGRHLMPWQRTPGRAAHLGVDVGVEDAVECVGATRRQGAADDRGDHEPQRRHGLSRQEHDRDGGEQQQLDDPRLHQRDVGTDD
jgi:hypothetical protein